MFQGHRLFFAMGTSLEEKVSQYRADNSIWNPATNTKPFMFIDDGEMDYDRTPLLIDHISRVLKLM